MDKQEESAHGEGTIALGHGHALDALEDNALMLYNQVSSCCRSGLDINGHQLLAECIQLLSTVNNAYCRQQVSIQSVSEVTRHDSGMTQVTRHDSGTQVPRCCFVSLLCAKTMLAWSRNSEPALIHVALLPVDPATQRPHARGLPPQQAWPSGGHSSVVTGVLALITGLVGRGDFNAMPDVGWDGCTRGFVLRRSDPGLCRTYKAAGPPDSAEGGPGFAAAVTSLLALLLELVEVWCGSSCAVARQLLDSGLLCVLEEVMQLTTDRAVKGAHAVLRALALHSKAIVRSVLETCSLSAVSALLSVEGLRGASRVALLQRTAILLEGCGGMAFADFTGLTPNGRLLQVVEMLHAQEGLSSAWRGAVSAGTPVTTGQCTGSQHGAHAARAVVSAALTDQEAALRKAALQVVSVCLQRAQRMSRLGARQIPGGGAWSQHPAGLWLRLLAEAEGRLQSEAQEWSMQVEIPNDHPHSGSEQAADGQGTAVQGAPGRISGRVLDVLKAQGDVPCMPTSCTGGASAGDADVRGINNTLDEDGCRVVWSSGPTEEVRAARQRWIATPLHQLLTWTQTSSEVNVTLQLPAGTRKHEVVVEVEPKALTVLLTWRDRVLSGALARRVRATECRWHLEDDGVALVIMLVKDGVHYWRALMEGAEEKSLWSVLQEAVNADEPLPTYSDMDANTRELLEELQERQAMIMSGDFDLKGGFDDFRVVIGDNTL